MNYSIENMNENMKHETWKHEKQKTIPRETWTTRENMTSLSQLSGISQALSFLLAWTTYCFWEIINSFTTTRVGRAGKNWCLPLLLTGLNWLAESPSGKNWQKPAKTKMTQTVCFLVSNCLKCTNVFWMLLGPIVHFASLVSWLVIT